MNVLFIAIDALRADRLGCYGYKKPTTPFIDQLAKNGVVFENHFTPVVPTQPAFTTLFSGVHPLTHRVVAHEGKRVPNPAIGWLPQVLRHHNFHTVAIDNLVDHKQWFARGFEYYVNPRKRGEYPDCHTFNERAVEWLTKTRREPFFMAMHYWDSHTPYLPNVKYLAQFYEGDPTATNKGSLEPFYAFPQVERWPTSWFDSLLAGWPHKTGKRIEDVNFLLAAYDAEVRTADDGVREICQTLEKLGLFDDTLLFVFSDHGEELGGDHGIFFDHHGLYDSNIRCPMIVHWPRGLAGCAGKRISAMSQHQDLFATVLDAAGMQTPEVVEGKSLLPLARGQQSTSHWNHTLMTLECTWQAKWALRTPEYKLIVAREPDFHGNPPLEVYDLLDDPGERHNIAAESPLVTQKLVAQFDANLRAMMLARNLRDDPVALHGVTLGKRIWQRLGKPYPNPEPKWRGHRVVTLRRRPPAATPSLAPAKPADSRAARPSG